MIADLLLTHSQQPYPDGYRGIEIANVDLVMLAADVVGLTSSFVERGALSDLQLPIMRDSFADADRIVPLLHGYAREYFARIRDLAAAVLKESHGDPAA